MQASLKGGSADIHSQITSEHLAHMSLIALTDSQCTAACSYAARCTGNPRLAVRIPGARCCIALQSG